MKREGFGGAKQCLNFKDSLLVFRTTPACGHCFTPTEMVEVDYCILTQPLLQNHLKGFYLLHVWFRTTSAAPLRPIYPSTRHFWPWRCPPLMGITGQLIQSEAPNDSVQLVQITPITMVEGTYNYS